MKKLLIFAIGASLVFPALAFGQTVSTDNNTATAAALKLQIMALIKQIQATEIQLNAIGVPTTGAFLNASSTGEDLPPTNTQ